MTLGRMKSSHHARPDRRISVCLSSSLVLLFLFLSLVCSARAQSSTANVPPGPNFRGGFGPAMGIIIVIMVSAFFFMVFFSIYLRKCGEHRDPNAFGAGQAGPPRSRRAVARGLESSVVQAFPTLVYAEVKEHKIGKGALECAVCLCEFDDDETLRLLPKCDHVFHAECIDEWLSSHTTCPVCRCNLDPNAAPVPTAGASSEADVAIPVGETEEEQNQQMELPLGERSVVDHVSIVIEDPQAVHSPRTMQRTDSKNRHRWRWSMSLPKSPRFWRSYSTGHFPLPAGDDCERYTLRLPDNVRRDVMAGKFQRCPSIAAAEGNSCTSGKDAKAGAEGSNRGSRWSVGGRSFKLMRKEWAAKSDRWAFFTRTLSIVVPIGEDRVGEGSARTGQVSSGRGTAEADAAGRGAGSAAATEEESVKGKKMSHAEP